MEIPEEAVEAAAAKLYRLSFSNQALLWNGERAHPDEQRSATPEELSRHDAIKETYRDRARAVLEVALPLVIPSQKEIALALDRPAFDALGMERDGVVWEARRFRAQDVAGTVVRLIGGAST